MNEVLKEYEKVIDRLYEAEEWRKKKGCSSWEEVKESGGIKAYNLYTNLLKEAEQLQRDLHLHKVNAVG